MTAAFIYRPAPGWRIAVALAAAVAVHLAAIAFAERDAPAPQPYLPGDDPTEIEIIPGEPELSPPASDEMPPPAPPPPVMTETLIEEKLAPKPVPVARINKVPLVPRSPQPSRALAPAGAGKVLALAAPRPEYPYEARRQHLTGSGVALLSIDPSNGSVLDVQMAQSTGSALLDNAARAGFRRWRFRPGTVSQVQTPITFTLTGAAF